MTDRMQDPVALAALPPASADHDLTPAMLQPRRALLLRRLFALGLCALTLALVLAAVARVFGDGGLDALEWGILACVGLSAPWTILGFWNSLLGLFLARPGSRTIPFAADGAGDAPVRSRVAVTMAIRNEAPERAFRRMLSIRRSLDETGHGARFDLHIISDTDIEAVARAEDRLFARHRAELDGRGRAGYRRREANTGYKAGNVWDFLHGAGAEYDLFVPLDADSIMSGARSSTWCASRRRIRASASCRASRSARRRTAPSGGCSSSGCATGCAPSRWAARGGRGTAARSGATTP